MLALQEAVRQVAVEDAVVDYILAIVERTRWHEALALGVSPRGSQALFRAAQALALIEGRDFAVPDDVKRLAAPLFGHRVAINTRTTLAQRRAEAGERIIEEILSQVEVPLRAIHINENCNYRPAHDRQDFLFTILTGVHQETRIGSTAARTGVSKVPDTRLDALAQAVRAPKIRYATVEYRGHAGDFEGESARPQLPGQPARGGRVRARAAAVRG